MTNNPAEAHILYLVKDMTKYPEDIRRPDQYLSQFPYETALTMKHNLGEYVQEVFGFRDETIHRPEPGEPSPTPLTFDLKRHAPAFLGEYMRRQHNGDDNLWIVKPTNLARSLDAVVTSSVDCVLKQMETVPKIVQKYI